MKQKQIKAIKKQIVEESAINVGYYESVIPAIIENIDPDTFYHLMGRSSGEWLLEAAKSNNRAEFQNIFVSEAVKTMSYSEFKTIAHYFFSYQQTSEEIIASPLEVTNNLFNTIQKNANNIFNTTITEEETEKNMDKLPTNFESIQNQILEELRKAQSDFKQSMIKKNPTEIFDYASKILYVSDALFELEHFVEEFTPEDYQDRSYSYEKQLGALFDRYDSTTPENGSETFMMAAERAWYDSSVNYEVGSDDKADFMENYIADYFGLSPYLKPQETKGVEMTNDAPHHSQSKSQSI